MDKKILIIPIPKFLLFFLMLIFTLIFKFLPFKNQLDYKQYRQMTGEAFVCSGAKLSRQLGWDPQVNLEKSLQKAIKGYKEAGRL